MHVHVRYCARPALDSNHTLPPRPARPNHAWGSVCPAPGDFAASDANDWHVLLAGGTASEHSTDEKERKRCLFRVFLFFLSFPTVHTLDHPRPSFCLLFVFSSGHQLTNIPVHPTFFLLHLVSTTLTITSFLDSTLPTLAYGPDRTPPFFPLRYYRYLIIIFWTPANIIYTHGCRPTWPSTRNAPPRRRQRRLQPASIRGAKARMATSWQAPEGSPRLTQLPSSPP